VWRGNEAQNSNNSKSCVIIVVIVIIIMDQVKGIPAPEDACENAGEVAGITTVVRAPIKLRPNNIGAAASSTHGV
jgi:hypothetical protein